MGKEVNLNFSLDDGGAQQLDAAPLLDTSPLHSTLKQIISQVALHAQMLRNLPKPVDPQEGTQYGELDRQPSGESAHTSYEKDSEDREKDSKVEREESSPILQAQEGSEASENLPVRSHDESGINDNSSLPKDLEDTKKTAKLDDVSEETAQPQDSTKDFSESHDDSAIENDTIEQQNERTVVTNSLRPVDGMESREGSDEEHQSPQMSDLLKRLQLLEQNAVPLNQLADRLSIAEQDAKDANNGVKEFTEKFGKINVPSREDTSSNDNKELPEDHHMGDTKGNDKERPENNEKTQLEGSGHRNDTAEPLRHLNENQDALVKSSNIPETPSVRERDYTDLRDRVSELEKKFQSLTNGHQEMHPTAVSVPSFPSTDNVFEEAPNEQASTTYEERTTAYSPSLGAKLPMSEQPSAKPDERPQLKEEYQQSLPSIEFNDKDLTEFQDRMEKYEKELEKLRQMMNSSPRRSPRPGFRKSTPNIGRETGKEESSQAAPQVPTSIVTLENEETTGADDMTGDTANPVPNASKQRPQEIAKRHTNEKTVAAFDSPKVNLLESESENFSGELVAYIDEMFEDFATRIIGLEDAVHRNQLAIRLRNKKRDTPQSENTESETAHESPSITDNPDHGPERYSLTSPQVDAQEFTTESSLRVLRSPVPMEEGNSTVVKDPGSSGSARMDHQRLPFSSDTGTYESNYSQYDMWAKLMDKADKKAMRNVEDKINDILGTISDLQEEMKKMNTGNFATSQQVHDLENLLAEKADRKTLRDMAGLNYGGDNYTGGNVGKHGITMSPLGEHFGSPSQQTDTDGSQTQLGEDDMKKMKTALNTHAKHIQMLHKTKADSIKLLELLDEKAEQIEKLEQFKADGSIVARKADRDYVENALEKLKRESKQSPKREDGENMDEMVRDLEYLKNLLKGKASRQELADLRDLINEIKKPSIGATGEGLVGHKGFRCLSCNRQMPGMRERPSKMNFEGFLGRLSNPKTRMYPRHGLSTDTIATTLPPSIISNSPGRSNRQGVTRTYNSNIPKRNEENLGVTEPYDDDVSPANPNIFEEENDAEDQPQLRSSSPCLPKIV